MKRNWHFIETLIQLLNMKLHKYFAHHDYT